MCTHVHKYDLRRALLRGCHYLCTLSCTFLSTNTFTISEPAAVAHTFTAAIFKSDASTVVDTDAAAITVSESTTYPYVHADVLAVIAPDSPSFAWSNTEPDDNGTPSFMH